MVNSRDELATSLWSSEKGNVIDWVVDDNLVDYQHAQQVMDALATNIASGEANERVWLLEHPPLYTAGTSTNPKDLVDAERFPVHQTGRGGQYTYHGPGQRIAYVMLNLNNRGKDVRRFVAALEQWIISTLEEYSIRGERREDRVGVWVRRPHNDTGAEDKIAAIGIRVRKWVTFHGISINLEPDLDHYSGIVPCGISEHGVTSLVDLGIPVTMPELDCILRREFEKLFGPVKI
ncbi:MAG: lipoyl(octanoyl) transferase LipB [Cohaesibacteraceae bacterium]|nr:lipoyl(octanoyl) transferase LipB [Cohaesibacteraceae bacterium]